LSQRAYRILLVVALVAVVLAALRAVTTLDEPEVDTVASDERAFSILDALQQGKTDIAVRGHVYDDGAFLQLCSGLKDGSPPTCAGPSLLLRQLDLNRLDLERGDVAGTEVVWTEQPVVLTGMLDGTVFNATDILGDG